MGSSRGSTPIHHNQHNKTTRTALGRGYLSTTPQISPIWWFFPRNQDTAAHQPAQGNREQQNPLAGVSPSPSQSTAQHCSPAGVSPSLSGAQHHPGTSFPSTQSHRNQPAAERPPGQYTRPSQLLHHGRNPLSAQHCLTRHIARSPIAQHAMHRSRWAMRGTARCRAPSCCPRSHPPMGPDVMCHVAGNRPPRHSFHSHTGHHVMTGPLSLTPHVGASFPRLRAAAQLRPRWRSAHTAARTRVGFGDMLAHGGRPRPRRGRVPDGCAPVAASVRRRGGGGGGRSARPPIAARLSGGGSARRAPAPKPNVAHPRRGRPRTRPQRGRADAQRTKQDYIIGSVKPHYNVGVIVNQIISVQST